MVRHYIKHHDHCCEILEQGPGGTLRYDALVAEVDASISSLESTKSDLEGTMADDESSGCRQ